MPDRIFLHSDMETAIVVARKHHARMRHVVYREVRDQDRRLFHLRHKVTWEDKVPQSYFVNSMNNRLIVPLLREIWEKLDHYRRLGPYVEIRKGVEYKLHIERSKVVRPVPFQNSKAGIAKVTKGFSQFLAKDTVYLSMEKQYQRSESSNAWNLNWEKPKVVVPASRISRGPWRYAAAIDYEGRIINRSFYAVWPRSENLNVELLASLLNSPVAAAFSYAHSFQRTIPKRVYEDIPIPEVSSDSGQIIYSLVHNYVETLQEDNNTTASNILLQIDAEILKLYELPPRLERQLLDIFWGCQRPVPFKFTGYVPLEIDSWIPLHVFISDQFKQGTPQEIMERIPVIRDEAFLDYLKKLGRAEE
jgi:hypothetical protein